MTGFQARSWLAGFHYRSGIVAAASRSCPQSQRARPRRSIYGLACRLARMIPRALTASPNARGRADGDSWRDACPVSLPFPGRVPAVALAPNAMAGPGIAPRSWLSIAWMSGFVPVLACPSSDALPKARPAKRSNPTQTMLRLRSAMRSDAGRDAACPRTSRRVFRLSISKSPESANTSCDAVDHLLLCGTPIEPPAC